MRILVLGSGAREHALVLALKAEGGHAFLTEQGGAACGISAAPYVSDCDYDQAKAILSWIYGPLAASSTDLAVRVDANGSSDYSAIVSTTAFRVVEAAITDARRRHAGRVTIRSRGGDGALTIEIVDDGPAGPGTALAGLEPQVAALSGKISVEPHTGGSRVRMALPCAS